MPLSGQQGDFSLSADSLIRSTTKTQPAVDKPVIRADDVAFNVTVRPHFSDLVCTNPPYFALRDIQALGNNTITAKVITESGIENEIGIITGAEAGRHLAILGTCAYTRLDPAKKICLATDAEITFSDTHPTQPGPLTAIGTAFPIDSRNCWAKTTLSSASGVEICSLSVQYTLFSERTFLRLFSGHRVSGPIKGDSNPYVSCIYVEQLQANGHSLTATLGPIRPEYCLGHFDEIPALPVAVVMGNLSHSAGHLLQSIVGVTTPYRVKFAKVSAKNLAFVGDRLFIEVQLVETISNAYFFLCRAFNQNQLEIGSMMLELRI